jgi:hypothetical protein
VKADIHSTPSIVATKPLGLESQITGGAHHVKAVYEAEKSSPEDDFTIECELAGGEGELVTLPYWHDGSGEGYFLMIFSPELREVDSDAEAGDRFVFVIDTSGGLGDRYLTLGVQTVTRALESLDKDDTFGIVAYDTFAETYADQLVAAGGESIETAKQWLKRLQLGGASDLSSAWKAVARLAGTKKTSVVYVGSGMSSLSSTKTGKLIEEAVAALGDANVTIHCLPIGSIRNDGFLAELAKKSNGTSRPIAGADDISERVPDLVADCGRPLYRNVNLTIEGVEVAETFPRSLPNVAAGRQLFVYGKYLAQGTASLRLSAAYENDTYERSFEVAFGAEAKHVCVPPLWATRKIEHLQREASTASGEKAEQIKRTVVETSKRYTVMSQYTSFLVLETAEDYARYGIERRVREFGPYVGTGGEKMGEVIGNFPIGGRGAGGADRANRHSATTSGKRRYDAKKEAAKAGKELRMMDKDVADASDALGVEENKLRAKPQRMRELASKPMAPSTSPSPAARAARPAEKAEMEVAAKRASVDGLAYADAPLAKKAYRKARELRKSADFKADTLAWSRTDIFPTMKPAEGDPHSNWPRGWRRSPADAMKVLRAVSSRYRTLTCTVKGYSVSADGSEKESGRPWNIVIDAQKGAYVSYRVGADSKDVCDGERIARFFPQLKHCAIRDSRKTDVLGLAATLPGYLVPWAAKLDREYVVTVHRRDEKGVVLKLQSRRDRHSYTLLYLESERGPVVKIEVFGRRRQGRRYLKVLLMTVQCTDIREIAGVRVPTVFRATPASTKAARGHSARVPGLMRTQVVRLTDIAVNEKVPAAAFDLTTPKDWTVRDQDVQPGPKERNSISRPATPPPDFGRRGR